MNKEIIDLLVESNNTLLSLFEVDGDNKREKEVNKIKRERKDKDGNETEVVSVADELFPYKGTAKEQFNQKVIAKINDMIEGTATLQDLIQLVRQGKSIKESLSDKIVEEIIYTLSEGNPLNKAKKEQWENKLNNITPIEKYERTEKIKQLANLEKDSKDIANSYGNKIVNKDTDLEDLKRAEEDRDYYSNMSDRAKELKNEEINNFSKKFKNRKEIKENLDTSISLLEEIISEVSDELKRRAQQKADNNVKLAELEKDMVKDAFNLGTKGVTKEDVNNAKLNVQKQVDRAAKLDNAIMKHTLAKMQGKIKPANENINKNISLIEEIISEISQETKNNAWNKAYDEVVKRRGQSEDEERRYKKGWSHPDNVMNAHIRLSKAEERYFKMDDAIRKHNQAKADGKIKPHNKKKEEKDDSK